MRRPFFALLLVPLLATCGGSGEPSDPVPVAFLLAAPPVVGSTPWADIVNGNSYTIMAVAVDAQGDPVDAPGISVQLEVTLGSAILTGTTTGVTGPDGRVTLSGLELTGPTGPTQLTLSSDSLPSVSSPVFTLKVGAAHSIERISGDSQAAVTHDTLTVRPTLEVRDVAGNAVPGIGVLVSVVDGSGTVTSPTNVTGASATYTSGANGRVRVRWRVGNVGVNRISYQISGHAELGIGQLLATAAPAAPWRFDLLSIYAGQLVVDSTRANVVRMTVRDKWDNLVPGAAVEFYQTSGVGNATFFGAQGTTDANGEFILAGWRADTIAGSYTIGARPVGGAAEVLIAQEVPVVAAAPAKLIAFTAREFLLVPGWQRSGGVRVVDKFSNTATTTPVVAAILSGAGTLEAAGDATGSLGFKVIAPADTGVTTVRATSPALPDSALDYTFRVVRPVAFEKVDGDGQVVTAGTVPPEPFWIRLVDSAGNGIAGVPLRLMADPWTTLQNIATDTLGEVKFSPPAMPLMIGYKHLAVASDYLGDGSVQAGFVVRLVGGPPAIVAQYMPSQDWTTVGDVGQPLALLPKAIVVDANSLGVEGVVVHFATSHGTLSGDSTVTDEHGLAQVPGWTLDTIAGVQQVTASVPGITPGLLVATARPGPTTTLTVVSSGTVQGFAGERLGHGIIVEGRDRYGNLAAGRNVVTSVASGDAVAFYGPTPLAATGRAYIDQWTLGAAGATSILRATSDSGMVEVSATALTPSPFRIVLRGVPTTYAGFFTRAAYDWRRRITADIPDITVNIAGGQCAPFQGGLGGTVDDLVIDVSIGTIDGPGAILGGATPCYIRTASKLPILGVMQFDVADAAILVAEGTFGDVVLHEMGHVLGIGSLWTTNNLLTNPGTVNPQYVGVGGKEGWAEIGGVPLGVTTVPVENTGSAGTRDSHWREIIMPSELMTGYLSALVNPMSAVTVRSLTDLGYTVDASTADPYTVMTAPMPAPGRPPRRIRDEVGAPRFTVDEDGKITPIE